MSAKRPWLVPLSPVYEAAVGIKNRFYDRGWLSPRRLERVVISVGSLSTGGAGKTPVVMMLAGMCEQMGASVDVLTRGYGRLSRAVEQAKVVNGYTDAALYGDESVEMTQAGIRVFVGGDRYAAGHLAEQTATSSVHLLDDGLQHRRLDRDLEIVLLTVEDVADCLLPAGNLREELASLSRAHVIVLREEEAESLRSVVLRYSTGEIWIVRRELKFGVHLARPYVFCGIARPQGFLAMVEKSGSAPVGSMIFKDHHRYEPEDIASLIAGARSAGADGFYMTAKDAVKLCPQWVEKMRAIGPVCALHLHVSMVEDGPAKSTLAKVLSCG